MRKIETEIRIQATPDRVWSVLTDFKSFPDWNPFIRSISGREVVGEMLEVQLKPPGAKGMTFRPEILKFDLGKEFRWKGKLFFKGVFDGEHYFILEKIGESETRFIHGEIFSGFLVGLLDGMLFKTKDGFNLMNKAIKVQSEQKL